MLSETVKKLSLISRLGWRAAINNRAARSMAEAVQKAFEGNAELQNQRHRHSNSDLAAP